MSNKIVLPPWVEMDHWIPVIVGAFMLGSFVVVRGNSTVVSQGTGIFIWLLMVWASWVDLKTETVHRWVPWALFGVGFLYEGIFQGNLLGSVAGVGFNLVVMGILYVLSKGGVGFGDIQVIGALGAYLGVQGSITLLFHASWLGALVALCFMFLKKKTRQGSLPFVPMIAAGFLLAVWGF